MKEWLVKLRGDNFDLQELPSLFHSPEATVLEEGGLYYLKSTDFNSLTDAGDVLETARHLLEIINGAAILNLGNFLPVQVDNSVIGIDQEGNVHRFSFGYGTGRRVSKLPKNALKAEMWLAKARKNQRIADALRFLCEQNWINLYKIYEIVRDDIGNPANRGWVTKRDQSRFTQTAQSQDVLGDAARHASKKYKPPARPMSLVEARSFIRAVLLNWLG